MTPNNPHDTSTPLGKARAVLTMLPPEERERVLQKLDLTNDQRRALFGDNGDANAPLSTSTAGMAHRRRVMREAMAGVHQRRMDSAAQQLQQHGLQGVATPSGEPLDHLRSVHPVALARALQGERPEAWALVLGHVDARSRAALEAYLDAAAMRAIRDAEATHQSLPDELRETVRRALVQTVVPRALREHQLLMTPPHTRTQ